MNTSFAPTCVNQSDDGVGGWVKGWTKYWTLQCSYYYIELKLDRMCNLGESHCLPIQYSLRGRRSFVLNMQPLVCTFSIAVFSHFCPSPHNAMPSTVFEHSNILMCPLQEKAKYLSICNCKMKCQLHRLSAYFKKMRKGEEHQSSTHMFQHFDG